MWQADKLGYRGNTNYNRAYEGDELVWEKPTGLDYLNFTALEDSTIYIEYRRGLTDRYSGNAINLDLSYDRENWYSITINKNTQPINIPKGYTLWIKGVNSEWGKAYNNMNLSCHKFTINNGLVKAAGNVCSLIDGQIDGTTLSSWGGRLNSNNLNGFPYLFDGCTNLVSAPLLPATNIGSYSYYHMFSGCTNLDKAPELMPIQDLGHCNSCYYQMFGGCTSLTEAPILYAENVGDKSYREMFQGCTSLRKVITYAQNYVEISGTGYGSLRDWLKSVSTTGDFYNLGGATYEAGTSGIPTGWTEHTSL